MRAVTQPLLSLHTLCVYWRAQQEPGKGLYISVWLAVARRGTGGGSDSEESYHHHHLEVEGTESQRSFFQSPHIEALIYHSSELVSLTIYIYRPTYKRGVYLILLSLHIVIDCY